MADRYTLTTTILDRWIQILERGSVSGERSNPVVTFGFRVNCACQVEIARYFGMFELIICFIPAG